MNQSVDYIALGSRIRKAREAKEMTQAELGERSALSTAHIGHIERGTRILSVEALFRIACTLEVSTDFLLFDSYPDDENLFVHIAPVLKGKPPEKVRAFLAAVHILAEKIEEL